jgi:hypothetical protein
MAVSTLSSWENGQALPLPSRLSIYAQFFATERSAEGEKLQLVPLDELSPSEEQVREDLERELLRLREDIANRLPSAHRSWRFDDEALITVICSDLRKSDQVKLGTLSEEDNPNYAELYSYGDLDALIELYGHLCSANPNADIRLRREATSEDLINHLVLLGGFAWNAVTKRLNDMLDLPVRQVVNEKIHSGEVFEIVGGPSHGEQFLPRWREGDPGTVEKTGVLLEDVGMLARLPNPYNELRTLTYCNGIHSRGVLGAVRCLTDRAVRDDNERFLEETFPGSNHFVILMRVPVLGNQTISPSLKSPRTVLFRWPGDARGN